MSYKTLPTSAVDYYARVLKNGRKSRLSPNYPQPQPPSAWPEENVALLERYLVWLIADGAGVTCITSYYLPMAGHVLGFNLKPHSQLNFDNDLEQALAYIQAKRPSGRWALLCGNALNRFRRFMRSERGIVTPAINFKPLQVARYHEGLPTWLIEQLSHYQQLRQANWRPARLNQAILKFWSSHTRLWRWLFAHYAIESVSDIKRHQVFAYMDERLAADYNPKSVNQDLRAFQASLHFLRERDFVVPQALLRLPGLKEPDSLPRFLTDEQVSRLQADFEQRVQTTRNPVQQRDALLDRAAFYLLWQGGLRLGEVEELTLDDTSAGSVQALNLNQRQLLIRQGKGLKDRAVYLTDTATSALQAYLAVRGEGESDHLFLFRHQPLNKDFLRERLKAAGERCGLKVTPHQLRHILRQAQDRLYATQLLNAGCKITTIQALLGHKHLNTTLTYARVHDHTVAQDYFAAMTTIEARLPVPTCVPTCVLTHPHPNQFTDDELGTGTEQGEVTSTCRPTHDAHEPQFNRSDPLLTLLNALDSDRLDEQQQAIVTQLRHTLLALTQPLAQPQLTIA